MTKRMTPSQLWRAARVARLLRGPTALEPTRRKEPSQAKNHAAPQTIQEMSHLIGTAELLRDAIWAKDKQEGAGAMATVLLQFMTTFGHDEDFVRKPLPSLVRLPQLVLGGDFDRAAADILEWLARLRQMTTGLARVLRMSAQDR